MPPLIDSRLSERGAFVVLVALVLVAMFGFVALALDAGRVFSSHTEKKATADHMALAALEAYWSAPIPVVVNNALKHEQRFLNAVSAAVKVGTWNTITHRGFEQQLSTTADLWPGPNVGAGTKGSIKSGRWWMTRPTCDGGFAPSCPCSDALPCFQPCDDVTGCAPASVAMSAAINGEPDARPYATAIKTSVFTASTAGSGIQGIFSRVIGTNEVGVGASSTSSSAATAAGLAKIIFVMVDVSRTMVNESFVPWEKTPPGTTGRMEFAYKLNIGSCGALPLDQALWPIRGPAITGITTPANGNDQWLKAWQELSNAERAEYQCKTAFNASGGTAERYAVNTVRTPEPLNTALRTAHEILRKIKETAFPGDLVGLVFFDQYFPSITTLPARLITPVQVTSGAYQTLLDVTNPDPSFLDLRLSYGVLPRITTTNYGMSDISLAMGGGTGTGGVMGLFGSLTDFFSSENSVYVVTNGLTNCGRYPNYSGTACRGYLRGDVPSWGGGWAGNAVTTAEKEDHYKIHKYALASTVFGRGAQRMKANKVKLHVALVGGYSTPHNVLIRSIDNPAACMDPEEIRRRNYLDVLIDPFYSVTPDDLQSSPPTAPVDDLTDAYDVYHRDRYYSIGSLPSTALDRTKVTAAELSNDYLQPDFYLDSAVRYLQGDWIPIRPPCPGAVTAATFDAICAGSPMPPTILNVTTRVASLDTELYVSKPALGSSLYLDSGTGTTMDADGRVVCEHLLPEPQTCGVPANCPPYVLPRVEQQVKSINTVRPILLVDK